MKITISKMVGAVQTSQVVTVQADSCGDDFEMFVGLDKETYITFAKVHILPEESEDPCDLPEELEVSPKCRECNVELIELSEDERETLRTSNYDPLERGAHSICTHCGGVHLKGGGRVWVYAAGHPYIVNDDEQNSKKVVWLGSKT